MDTKKNEMENPNERSKIKVNKAVRKAFEVLSKSPVKIYALGGLGEVGKNMYCIEDDKTILIIDCGVMFPDDSLKGVNYVLPDMSYLQENQSKAKVLVVTHGHEDHIGGIPFLLQLVRINAIYAPKLALAFIRNKIKDFRLKDNVPLSEYQENTQITIGDFKISFFHVTHSVPDSYGVVVDTPQGRIVTTGDFKVDLTPIDDQFSLTKLVKLGNEGIDLLLADSTNAEKEGYTPSERSVVNAIMDIFSAAKGRIIISTFSSNISRLVQIIDSALKLDKKVCIIGKSMEANIRCAQELGFIRIPESRIVKPEKANLERKSDLVILCTGSQGEPLAALSRFATGEHKYITLSPGDTIIFSSSPIPGNTQGINELVNKLIKIGCDVYQNDERFQLHASGHPCRTELRLIQKLAQPKNFMPVHGEYRMLKIHAEIAKEMGLDDDHVFICQNGDILTLYNHNVSKSIEKVQTDSLYIEGFEAISLSTAIIRDRNVLTNEGCVNVTLFLDPKENKLMLPPLINTRGFVNTYTKTPLFYRMKDLINASINRYYKTSKHVTYQQIKDIVKNELGKFLFKETKKTPMIIPVIVVVNQDFLDFKKELLAPLNEIKEN